MRISLTEYPKQLPRSEHNCSQLISEATGKNLNHEFGVSPEASMHWPLPRSVYVVTVVRDLTMQLLPPSCPDGSPPLVKGSCNQRTQLPELLLEYPKHPVSDEHNCSQSAAESNKKLAGSPPAQSAQLPLPRSIYVMTVVLVTVPLLVALTSDVNNRPYAEPEYEAPTTPGPSELMAADLPNPSPANPSSQSELTASSATGW
jgi:hypothetical protein